MSDASPPHAKPSDYELQLLRPLWSAPRLSARELHEASSQRTSWSYSATRKTLDRMVAKGLVRIETVHGIKTYAATQSKLQTMAVLIRNFASKVFDTDIVPVAAFAHSKLINADEIKDLEELIRDLGDCEDGKNTAS